MNARGKPIQATSLLMVSSSIFFLLLAIYHSDLIDSLFCTVLTQAEIDRLVAHLFDKYPPTTWPASVPMHFCSENSPLLVSITVSSGILYTCS
jgi:hypothetical protein